MGRVTIEQLFAEAAARNKAAAEAQDADPVWQAKEAERRRLDAERIDREIAAGLRTPEGDWIETEDEDEGEDYDPSQVEDF